MDKLFKMQRELQERMYEEERLDIKTSRINDGMYSKDLVYKFIAHMQFCLNEEVSELLEEMGDGTRDIHKPWKKSYASIRLTRYIPSSKVREEAVDMLCFAMNICLAAGLDENNIMTEYIKVHNKVIQRLKEDT